MSANALGSVDTLKNLRFDCIFHLNDLSGDSDDCLRFDCIFHYLNDLSGNSDDC